MLLSKVFATSKGRHVWPERTICEVHREIFDLLSVGYDQKDWSRIAQIIPLLEEAYTDGIKMTKKLVDYKISLPDWEKNTPDAEKLQLRKLRTYLESQLKLKLALKLALVYDPNDYKLSDASYSKNYRAMFDSLSGRFNTTHVTKNCSANDLDCDVIIYFDPHSCNTLCITENNKLTYEYFNDPHQKDCTGQYVNGPKFHKVGPEGRARRAKVRNTSFVICPSKTGYKKYLEPVMGDKLVWFPVVPKKPDFDVKLLKDRERMVVSCGHTWIGNNGFNPYLFRKWVHEQSYIGVIQHVKDNKKTPVGQDYIRLLSNYVGSVSACDEYVVAKYFENSLAGCINLMQWHEECEELGFVDAVNCFFITKDNLKNTVRKVVNEPEFYQLTADMGRQLIEEHWTSEKFADFIHEHARKHV